MRKCSKMIRKIYIMKDSDAYYEKGPYSFTAYRFLILAAVAADECTAKGFALKAHTAHIMAAICAEAFIDEFAFSLSRANKVPELARIGTILQQLEESRVQITEKYKIASQLLPGIPYDSGREPFQSFSHLIKLRNSLAHPKIELTKPPKWFSYFVAKGLVVESVAGESPLKEWMTQLQSKSSASWACRSTANIILHLIERIKQPCTEYTVPGIYQRLRSGWEWTETDTRF